MIVVEDAKLVRDGGRGDDVVAGEHFQVDARALAGVYRIVHFCAQRIGDADEPIEDHAAFRILAAFGLCGNIFVREGEHAARALLQPHDLRLVLLPLLFGNIAKGKYLFGAALRVNFKPVLPPHDGRHVLRIRKEGIHLGDIRRLPLLPVIDAAFARGNEQRPFRGVAHKAHRAALFVQIGGAVDAVVFQHGKAAKRGNVAIRPVRIHVHHGHAVFGQRARFIRTDDVDTADGLAGDHLFDERVLLCHFRYVDGQRDRHNGGKPLGHRRDHEDDALDEGIADVLERYGFVYEDVHELDDEYERRANRTDDGDDLAELAHLLLQGRLPVSAALNLARDQPEFGIVAHARYDHFARAARDEAAGKDHVRPLGDGDVARKPGGGVLFHRHTFAREGRFVACERNALDEPAVGDHFVARFKVHDIARDEFALRYVLHDAVAHDLDLDALFDLVQLLERLGAFAFHDDGEHHGYGDGDEYADTFDEVAVARLYLFDDIHRDGDDPCEKEKDEHGLGGSFPNAPQERLLFGFGKHVPAVLFRVFLHLPRSKAGVRIRTQLFYDLFRALLVKLQTCNLPMFFRQKRSAGTMRPRPKFRKNARDRLRPYKRGCAAFI